MFTRILSSALAAAALGLAAPAVATAQAGAGAAPADRKGVECQCHGNMAMHRAIPHDAGQKPTASSTDTNERQRLVREDTFGLNKSWGDGAP